MYINLLNLNTGKRSIFSLALIVLCLSACNKDQHNHPELSSGKELFEFHCASCHQKNGLGTFLKGVPANISTEKNQPEIVWHITRGSQSPQSRMPVFSNMPIDEANKIAHHLLSLKRNFNSNPENRDKYLLKRQ